MYAKSNFEKTCHIYNFSDFVTGKSQPKPESVPGREHCSRPGCTMQGIAMEEFFIERFVGRYDRGVHGPARYAWLIQWEGYVTYYLGMRTRK